MILKTKQVCVQLPTQADNVALLASSAAAAIDRYLVPVGPTAVNL